MIRLRHAESAPTVKDRIAALEDENAGLREQRDALLAMLKESPGRHDACKGLVEKGEHFYDCWWARVQALIARIRTGW